MKHNALYYGDCLEVKRQWRNGFADLVYLDLPFNPNAKYNIPFGHERNEEGKGKYQAVAFQDACRWSEAAAERVAALERAYGNPAHSAIAGLRLMLGDCGLMAFLSYLAERSIEVKRILSPTGNTRSSQRLLISGFIS